MRKAIIILSLVFSGAAPAFAAFGSGDAGTSPAQFLKLGAGGRAAGMGEAFTGVADDATAVYWNPAGLASLTPDDGTVASAMHAVWFEDISYDWLSVAHSLGEGEAWGAGVQYASFGSLRGTDDLGRETGAFTPSDLALTFSYAKALHSVMLGGNLKYISSRIRNSAGTVALDFGMMMPLVGPPESKRALAGIRSVREEMYSSYEGEGDEPDILTLGAVVQNLGPGMKFVSESEPLPVTVRAGLAYRPKPGWTAAFDVSAPVDSTPSFGFGAEYDCVLGEWTSAAGRLGYNTRGKDTGGLNGITAGFGFTYLDYTIDYAFSPYGELGNTHRLSLGLRY